MCESAPFPVGADENGSKCPLEFAECFFVTKFVALLDVVHLNSVPIVGVLTDKLDVRRVKDCSLLLRELINFGLSDQSSSG